MLIQLSASCVKSGGVPFSTWADAKAALNSGKQRNLVISLIFSSILDGSGLLAGAQFFEPVNVQRIVQSNAG